EGARVRTEIGAALQEAALDPFLTGAEHMRLQTALHGLPKAERAPRGAELLRRVGLSDAADRRVGGYSGGMKRRLDLALALVHRPRILFLDEPTTGLDPQSRSALWAEVARLASDDGVTVFLTTQYLEEADVLADRVGIIDRGQIVAEGTPTALKAEVGRPSVEAIPADPHDRDAFAAALARLGEATKIPGFPADSYLDFALTVTFMQGALFAAVTAGTGLATDIETGFLDRLQLTPLRPYAVLAGQLAGAATLSMISITTYIAVGLIAGASIKAGVAGVAVLFVLALLVAVAFAGIGMIMAARTGQAEAVQGLFPLLF